MDAYQILAVLIQRCLRYLANTGLVVAGTSAGAVLGVSVLHPEKYAMVRDALYSFVVFYAAKVFGLNLQKDNPLSDASLCAAIADRTGVVLTTLRDRAQVRRDIETAAAHLIEEKTGGLKLHNFRDSKALKSDVLKYSTKYFVEYTGIPITDLSDRPKSQAQVKQYLKDKALIYLADDIKSAKDFVAEALSGEGWSVSKLVAEIESRGGVDKATGLPKIRVGAAKLVAGIVAEALIEVDERRRREVEVIADEASRKARRKVQMKEASKRFRAAHGHRLVYQPVNQAAGG